MKAAANTEPQTGPSAWHAVGADEVVSGLRTDPAKGLDAGVAAGRLTQYGPNRLLSVSPTPP
jgi:Cation transporter/ATPase, N-terminus